jgi:Zn-dependent protease with chaperone function
VSASGERRRLNPFAFPSDTGFRFLLLILSVVGAALFAFNWVYFSLSDSAHEVRVSARCAAEYGSVAPDISDPAGLSRRLDRLHACMAEITHPKGYWMLGGVAAMVLLAVVLYLLTPRWRMRRGRLVPLRMDDAPEVVAELERLSRQAGLARSPRFVWNPLNRASTGLAFGRFGDYRVAVSGGLVMLHHTDPDAFRAVALHELAHVRNRDIDRTYFTMALWYAFLAAAVLPLIVTLVDESAHTIWQVAWRLAALVLLVYLTRNAVLRARETYADVRADVTGGDAAIRRVVAGIPAPEGAPLTRLLRVHPDPAERLAALDDTDRLFRLGLPEALGAGIVLTLVFHELVTLIGFYETDPLTEHWLAALVAAPLVVGVVGLGIWRAAFAAGVRDTPLVRVWEIGVALAVGMLIGESISLDSLASGGRTEIVGSDLLGWGVLWLVAIVLGMVLFSTWVAAGATLWLRRGGRRGLRAAFAGGYFAASVVLTVWTGTFYLAHGVSALAERIARPVLEDDARRVAAVASIGPQGVYRWVMDPQIAILDSRWPVLPALIVLWAFPLAAGIGRGSGRVPDWAFLGGGAPVTVIPQRLCVRRALLVGVGLGVLVWVAALVLRVWIHADVGLERRTQDEFFAAFYYWSIGLTLGAQAVAAAVAAALTPRYRVLHGLLAAFVCGVLGAATIVLGPTAGSCIDLVSASAGPVGCPLFVDGPFVRMVYTQVLGEGAALALAAAGLVALAARGKQRAAANVR